MLRAIDLRKIAHFPFRSEDTFLDPVCDFRIQKDFKWLDFTPVISRHIDLAKQIKISTCKCKYSAFVEEKLSQDGLRFIFFISCDLLSLQR